MNIPGLSNHAIGILVLVLMTATASVFMFAAIMGIIVLWLPLVLVFAIGVLEAEHRSTRRSW
jgi:hypothetical protein